MFPVNLVDGGELGYGFCRFSGSRKLLDFSDLLPGTLEVRPIVGVYHSRRASTGDKTFQGSQEVFSGERCS